MRGAYLERKPVGETGKNDRVKTTAMVVLVMLVSVGLLMTIGYQRANRSMTEQLETNLSVTADRYAQELTAWINTNATIIDTLATEITTGGIYDEDYETFHSYLAENCRMLNRDGNIFDIYFTYPDNRMACASDFMVDGTVDYAHDREWFTAAAGTGELFYSTPYRDSDSGKPIITISKAVYRNNVLQGVLAADIFVDVLVDIISEADVAEDSYAFLVDQNLGMIVHPNEAYSFDDVPYGVMEIPGAPYDEVVSKIRSGSNETVYLKDYDGVTRGIAVSQMTNTGWYVGIAISRDVLMSSLNPMVRGFVIAAAVAAVVGGGMAVFLAYVLDKLKLQRQEYEEKVRHLENRGQDASDETERNPLSAASEEGASASSAELLMEHAGRINLRVPILIILFLMICMVLYTSRVINSVAVTNIQEVGGDRIAAGAAQLENYLGTMKSALWVTADSVDHMTHSGASPQDILDYITEETENQKQYFDVNITGLYGYVMGEYLDGLAWVPPENYDPTRRDWYMTALEAEGEIAIVLPYVDAQTDSVIISICRMLSNGTDVLSIDLMMDHIQEIVSDLQIKGKGYGFVVSRDGMIIAHQEEAQKGHYLTGDEEQLALLDGILETKNGIFEITTDREEQTVFVREIMDQWYVVIVMSNRELLAEVRQQLAVNVLICTLIFVLILFFYVLGRRNEQRYSRRIEEMRAEEQKQSYEAKVLKLEKEAADRANQAKSDFLADMSHEIRTPINAVLGMNEMILRESIGAQKREARDANAVRNAFDSISSCARNIESAGSNLLAIINDILDLSRIESGRMDIVEGKYQLSSVLNDLSNMIWFKAKEKNLEFSVDVDETMPDGLCGDEVRVRQVITNVLNNAVKYTVRGSVHLTVSGELLGEAPMAPGQTIVLKAAVRDTGIGIRQEDMDKLFNKFQRLDLKQNSTVEGTGLGLAITHSLLEMMGGSIEVQSEYGKGSVFTVTIPQKIAAVEPVGDFRTRFRKNLQEAEAYRESFRAPEARILIVDDTKMNLTVAVGLLRDTLVRIDTASGGEEAIALAKDNAYDVILMDQRMPKMDGSEALHHIREQTGGANRETPVICLTADAVIGAKERYIAEGFTNYLTKPIDSRALEQMLLRYLPAEKLTVVRDGETGDNGSTPSETEDGYAPLRRAGIDPETGLGYCQGDRDLYLSLLEEYAGSAQEKAGEIMRFYEVRDWKNYSVLAHAIKSSSRMIGAAALADRAADLEAAADDGRVQDIEAGHEKLLADYAAISQVILENCGDGKPPAQGAADHQGDENGSAESALQEDEILEFYPE
ncbi:MAG: response regulator [Oscillospiraceae bacterium]|nr:response regulator [Oscillospiraceae bacterium]